MSCFRNHISSPRAAFFFSWLSCQALRIVLFISSSPSSYNCFIILIRDSCGSASLSNFGVLNKKTSQRNKGNFPAWEINVMWLWPWCIWIQITTHHHFLMTRGLFTHLTISRSPGHEPIALLPKCPCVKMDLMFISLPRKLIPGYSTLAKLGQGDFYDTALVLLLSRYSYEK